MGNLPAILTAIPLNAGFGGHIPTKDTTAGKDRVRSLMQDSEIMFVLQSPRLYPFACPLCYECSQRVFSVMVTQRKSGFKSRNIRFKARVRICNTLQSRNLTPLEHYTTCFALVPFPLHITFAQPLLLLVLHHARHLQPIRNDSLPFMGRLEIKATSIVTPSARIVFNSNKRVVGTI
jgi:hypothetical protein